MANVLTLSTPLIRQNIGIDRFNDLFGSLLHEDTRSLDQYPPYNIEKYGEDDYAITMAVAGFDMHDLNIVLEDGDLKISGSRKDETQKEDVEFIYRGIAERDFMKSFRLADFIQVQYAELKDGLLTLTLKREIPEGKKPRMIPISGTLEKASSKSKKS